MLDQIIAIFKCYKSIEVREFLGGGLNLSSRHVATIVGLACQYQAAVPPRSSPLGTLSPVQRSQRRGVLGKDGCIRRPL